jgi:AcrR family transcriptional regulator
VDTRGEILAAARDEFAAKGYDGASLRGIARVAGVDPALVHHYFAGGKDAVFAAAMDLPLDPSAVPVMLAGDLDGLGERVMRFALSVWGRPEARTPALALLRAAMTHERAAAMLRGFVSHAVLGRVAAQVGTPDAKLRANLVASQVVGVVMLRYVVRVEPLASLSEDEVVSLVAPTLQRYLTTGLSAGLPEGQPAGTSQG